MGRARSASPTPAPALEKGSSTALQRSKQRSSLGSDCSVSTVLAVAPADGSASVASGAPTRSAGLRPPLSADLRVLQAVKAAALSSSPVQVGEAAAARSVHTAARAAQPPSMAKLEKGSAASPAPMSSDLRALPEVKAAATTPPKRSCPRLSCSGVSAQRMLRVVAAQALEFVGWAWRAVLVELRAQN